MVPLRWLAVFVTFLGLSVADRDRLQNLLELDTETGANSREGYVEVYVMMPLKTVTRNGNLDNPDHLRWVLHRLKAGQVDGFMVDVWWGITEAKPQEYSFNAYLDLVQIAEEIGLKVQFVASFHQCGGNVGDDCYIPLPDWVSNAKGIWYKDSPHGNENKEYISLFADHVKLPDGRTPIEAYRNWFDALAVAFADYLGSTITTVQVGMGPAGELRYPAYVERFGWKFPGIGKFQCWDDHALANLRSQPSALPGQTPPTDAGGYNSKPSDNYFWQGGYTRVYGKWFLDWYFQSLKNHGRDVLQQAAEALGHLVPLAGKVAGIHWWYKHPSHAAEGTAGYYNTNRRDAYSELASLFSEIQTTYGSISMDFTCLEMKGADQVFEAVSSPEELVKQMVSATKDAGVLFSGENALPVSTEEGYNQILYWRNSLHHFTFLRLDDKLLKDHQWWLFTNFVNRMHGLW